MRLAARLRGQDLIAFHVLNATELEFGFSDAQPFEDLESGEQMPVVPEAFREEDGRSSPRISTR